MGQPHSFTLFDFVFTFFTLHYLLIPDPSARGCQVAGVIPSARLYRGPRTILTPYTIQPEPNRTDSANRLRRDSFSGSGLSSPALQRSHRDSFSELPSGQLNKEISLTDSKREARIAGGSRPGIVYPLPRAARPDTRLEVAALSRAERPPTVLDIPETGRLEDTSCPESSQNRGSRSPRRHTRKQPRNRSSGVYRPKKRSPHRGHWCE